MNSGEREFSIDVKDLFRYVFRHFAVIVLVAVLVGAAYSGLGYFREAGYISSVCSFMQENPEYPYDVAESVMNLSEAEIENVRTTVEILKSDKEILDRLSAETETPETVNAIAAIQYTADSIKRSFDYNPFDYHQSQYDRKVLFDFLLFQNGDGLSREIPIASLSVKAIVVGVVVGAILMVGLYCAMYFFSSFLRVAEDIPKGFGVPVLFDVHEIKAIASKKRYKSVFLAGTEADKMKSEVSALGIFISDDIFSADAVVLAEKIGRSKYRDIEKIVLKAERLEIPIIGAFVEEK